jgi:hypothetical protein
MASAFAQPGSLHNLRAFIGSSSMRLQLTSSAASVGHHPSILWPLHCSINTQDIPQRPAAYHANIVPRPRLWQILVGTGRFCCALPLARGAIDTGRKSGSSMTSGIYRCAGLLSTSVFLLTDYVNLFQPDKSLCS